MTDPLRPPETDYQYRREVERELDSGAWLGLAILLLVAVVVAIVAFGAGYWMGGMR